MSTALSVIEVSPEQMELAKATIARGATDAEFALFLYDCKRRGVHPLDRLIHFTKRKNKKTGVETYTPIVSIDFLRSRALESGEYAGNDDPSFVEGPEHPVSATAVVYRRINGQRIAFAATARWKEYYPGDSGDSFMWNKMPHNQLGKCAEALALRKAFPHELSGLYSSDEISVVVGDDSDVIMPPPNQSTPVPPAPTSWKIREIKSPKKDNQPYLIYSTDGMKFSTYERELVETARACIAEKRTVVMEYVNTQYGNKLTAIRPFVEPTAPASNAGSTSPAGRSQAQAVDAEFTDASEPKQNNSSILNHFFKTWSIKPQQLEAYVMRPIAEWTDIERQTLRKLADSISTGAATIQSEFGS